MELDAQTDGAVSRKIPAIAALPVGDELDIVGPLQPQIQQHQPQMQVQAQNPQNAKAKRKHRRGKPKQKNSSKPYKTNQWKFQMPRSSASGGGGGGGVAPRVKLNRSQSLVPYNTNRFLMEEHMAEVPSALLTPSGRTRDSSFSVDSEDNYFYSLPEDEEEFLTKEFANVYEIARLERLEDMSKQQLIEEILQIEDRYTKDQGAQMQQQQLVQRITAEFVAKIRVLEEKVKELSRENYNLRSQLMRSAAIVAAAAASPPSATGPTAAASEPQPMDSSSEDTASDSSSSSSSSSSSVDDLRLHRRRSASISSSASGSSREYNEEVAIDNNENMQQHVPVVAERMMDEEEDGSVPPSPSRFDNNQRAGLLPIGPVSPSLPSVAADAEMPGSSSSNQNR